MNKSEDIIKDMQKGLIAWIKFNKEDRILYVGYETDSIAEYLKSIYDRGDVKSVCFCSMDEINMRTKNEVFFDAIISVSDIERANNPILFLEKLREKLNAHGRLYLGANNRLGIRYFCGDRDKYTGRNFDGIENYRRYAVKSEDVLSGRMYDKNELITMLDRSGIAKHKIYSVFPKLEFPSMLFADGYVPNEELNNRVFPMYDCPDTIFLEEEYLYKDLIENGMFHVMANAFLIECVNDAESDFNNVQHVTMSLDRGKQDALCTVVYNNQIVEKKAVFEEGVGRLKELIENSAILKKKGISVVEAVLKDNLYSMPFIEAESALSYLRRLAHCGQSEFISGMDKFYDVIMKSSDVFNKIVNGKDVKYFEKGFIDLVPLNSFYVNGKFVFYDQEFYIDECPVSVLVVRFIDLVYGGFFETERLVPREYFFKRYGVLEEVEYARFMEHKFLERLRKEKELAVFHNKYRRNPEVVNANRQRMNYSEEEYQRKFVDIFRNLGDRKLILFGSGAFTKRFIAMYGKSYEIACILDNNKSRWGQKLEGYEIKSPEYLKELSKEDYKVLICIKSYVSVAKQLESMGITDYGIFDTSRSYAKPVYRQEGIDTRTDLSVKAAQSQQSQESGTETKKKYHIGYVAGVFDMFHTGHVRLLQRAKELCDYLIVGVVSDEDCYRQKNKYPVISCEDRVEVVKACRYADQVKALPTGFGGIRDAYKMFQFDVQFSGDDHGDDGSWLAEKEYLNKHGADLVFFDYTKGISSTEIRERL